MAGNLHCRYLESWAYHYVKMVIWLISRSLRTDSLLNNRPRKSLGFKIPNQVFFNNNQVALTT
jgi:hypothetical protein